MEESVWSAKTRTADGVKQDGGQKPAGCKYSPEDPLRHLQQNY